jgi:hypothetical protein
LARIILSHALLESIRFVMSRKECRDIYGLINTMRDFLSPPSLRGTLPLWGMARISWMMIMTATIM